MAVTPKGLLLFWWILSWRMLQALASEWKYALAQELESATAVHLPFNKLEPVYLSFNLSIAPALFYRCQHSVVISVDSGGEAHPAGMFDCWPRINHDLNASGFRSLNIWRNC